MALVGRALRAHAAAALRRGVRARAAQAARCRGERRRADWDGRRASAGGAAPRIACLVPSLTELLFALGLGEHVVARTGFCVHPRDAVARVPKVGGTKDFDLDAARALAPTHLVVNVDENRREVGRRRARVRPARDRHASVRARRQPAALRAVRRDLRPRARGGGAWRPTSRRRSPRSTRPSPALPRERVALRDLEEAVDDGRARHLHRRDARARGLGRRAGRTRGARYPELADDDARVARRRSASCSRRSRTRSAPRDARRAARALAASPAHLVDGEMTSWYGPRAIAGMRYLARCARSHRRGVGRRRAAPENTRGRPQAASCATRVRDRYSGTRTPTVIAVVVAVALAGGGRPMM